jgi:hypothetical protein
MVLLSGLGGPTVSGAGPLQQIAVGPPPLPGGVAAVLRFFFNLPQWFQIAGFVVGVGVAAAMLWILWRSRAVLIRWLMSRPRSVKIGLAAAVAVAALAGAGFSAVSYGYIEHNNGFCTGCHVMTRPFQRFAGSKHDSLSCHACHQQSMFANMRQLYLWVAERPQSIGKHAKVPTRVCAGCHVRGDAKESWQRVASTAGHRVHLESDSSALKNVQCVTCHGLEVHRFVPVDSTCAQSGCHVTVRITLAKMSTQTDAHCALCHRFTADVPLLATRDSARGTLVPRMQQCFSCHQMQAVLAQFDPARDPHRGTCGVCHNPHTQKTAADAAQTCASAKCHADWRSRPFHVGKNHVAVAQNCTLCHVPHDARVDASDCAGCHAAVKQRRGGHGLNPPLPFDTTAALKRVSRLDGGPGDVLARGSPSPGRGGPSALDDPPWPAALHPPAAPAPPPPVVRAAAAADTFPHDRHKKLPCLTCHTSNQRRNRLTFLPPRGCQICHHQAPQTSDCGTCHATAALAVESVTVEVNVAGRPRREHSAGFEHATHKSVRCAACHTTPVSLAPGASVAACAACHDDHHAAGRRCGACHAGGSPDVRAAHAPPVEGHVACDACHPPAVVARLVPDRLLCLTCHTKQTDHYTKQDCTVCHFGASPPSFQHRLRQAGPRS